MYVGLFERFNFSTVCLIRFVIGAVNILMGLVNFIPPILINNLLIKKASLLINPKLISSGNKIHTHIILKRLGEHLG